MNARKIVKDSVVEVLSTGHHVPLASVKKNGARQWKITMWRATEDGMPVFEFTPTRREAIERMRFIYRAEG